jgi:large subunit ribosomal protein L23
MQNDVYTIIKRPIVTEKSTLQTERANAYTFLVDMHANKIEIKQAIEKIFKVKVESVRTQIRKGKKTRVRFKAGHGPDWKRAVVTLVEGQKIEVGAN